MPKITFSDEQSAIINASASENCNIVVDAVAGSGKTTCICGICHVNADKRLLVLTYNKHLCQETSERFKKFKFTNADIYTVHGFVYNFYDSSDYTDKIIRSTIRNDKPLRLNKRDTFYDIIVLDEFQDFNIHMVEVVVKYIRDMKLNRKDYTPKLVFLGDKFQCVYEDLHGSDNRFLIHAPDLFSLFGTCKRLTLQTTYRLTDHMVHFMNDTMLKSNFFVPFKSGKRKPVYLVTNVYSHEFHEYIFDYIIHNHYRPEDVFILAPSVKNSKSPIYKLTNDLSDNGFPIYYSGQFEDESSPDETRNKITVNTYHVCKGRERKLTIVMNFDTSYFDWFAKDKPTDVSTNPQYVAATRASEDIIFVRNYKEADLEFLDKDSLHKTCDVVYLQSPQQEDKKKKGIKVELSVTNLLDYLTYDVVNYGSQFYKTDVEKTDIKIVLPSSITCDYRGTTVHENIANLNGIMIALFIEYHLYGKLHVLDELKGRLKTWMDDTESSWLQNDDIRRKLRSLKPDDLQFPDDFITIALMLEAESTEILHRFKQINKRDWITPDHLEAIKELLNDIISK